MELNYSNNLPEIKILYTRILIMKNEIEIFWSNFNFACVLFKFIDLQK